MTYITYLSLFWCLYIMYNFQWIFWVGPFVGAAIAAFYHQFILRAAAIKALGSFRSNAWRTIHQWSQSGRVRELHLGKYNLYIIGCCSSSLYLLSLNSLLLSVFVYPFQKSVYWWWWWWCFYNHLKNANALSIHISIRLLKTWLISGLIPPVLVEEKEGKKGVWESHDYLEVYSWIEANISALRSVSQLLPLSFSKLFRRNHMNYTQQKHRTTDWAPFLWLDNAHNSVFDQFPKPNC